MPNRVNSKMEELLPKIRTAFAKAEQVNAVVPTVVSEAGPSIRQLRPNWRELEDELNYPGGPVEMAWQILRKKTLQVVDNGLVERDLKEFAKDSAQILINRVLERIARAATHYPRSVLDENILERAATKLGSPCRVVAGANAFNRLKITKNNSLQEDPIRQGLRFPKDGVLLFSLVSGPTVELLDPEWVIDWNPHGSGKAVELVATQRLYLLKERGGMFWSLQ